MSDDAVVIQVLLSVISQLQTINATLQNTQPATLTDTQTGTAGAQVVSTLTPPANTHCVLQGCLLTYSNISVTAGTVIGIITDGTFSLHFEFNESNTVNGSDFRYVFFGPNGIQGQLNAPITITIPALAGGGVVTVCAWGTSK